MVRFAINMVRTMVSLAWTVMRLALLPLDIGFGVLFGRGWRRLKTTALLAGVGLAAGAVAAQASRPSTQS